MGSKSKDPTQPVPMYYMSMHYGICHGPVDALTAVYIGEKKAWEGNITENGSVGISNEGLFGGLKKEGGVDGTMDVMLGGETQVVSAGLADRLGLSQGNCPAFRGMVSVLFRKGGGGFYWVANNPYLKTLWFTVFRLPRGLPPETAAIPNPNGGVDANPAHIIYECMTNTDWGMGAKPQSIDYAAFSAVAATLHDEEFGLSMVWAQAGTIEDFVNQVLQHINGSIFTHPRTGKVTIRLLREDYDPAALRVIDDTVGVLTSFSRKAWGETVNEMVVTWTNPKNEQEETVTNQDLGNIAVQGQVVSDSKNFYGVRHSGLAQRLCNRELRYASAPLCSMEMRCNRSLWDVTPLECVKVNWPEFGLQNLIMRVVKVNYGKSDDTTIALSLVEDVFSLPNVSFVQPPSTEWQPPEAAPEPITASRLFDAPLYFLINKGFGTDFTYPEAGAAVLAENPTASLTASFEVQAQVVGPSGSLNWESVLFDAQFCTSFSLASPLTKQVSSILSAPSGITPAVDDFLLIGDYGQPDEQLELALITSVDPSTGALTLRRGVLDTCPQQWSTGTKVLVFSTGAFAPLPEIYTDGQTLSVKLLTNTTLGQTNPSLAPTLTGAVKSRATSPYRPANIKIEGSYWPAVVELLDGELVVTWSRRNRLQEDTLVLPWDGGDVAPEAGTTYTVQLYRVDTDALVVQATGVTGTSAALVPTYSGMVRLRLTAVLDGQESYQPFEHVFELLTSEMLVTEEDAEEMQTESGEVIILEN